MTELSSKATQVLEALRRSAERHDGEWRNVYLDNALAKLPDMSITTFRRYLGVLSNAGLYRVVDGYAWGNVRCEPCEAQP